MSKETKNKMVPKLRFPQFEDADEWEVKYLCQISNVIAGQSPDGASYNEEGNGIAFYQGKTDFGSIFLNKPSKWTTKPTKIANNGDILMSVRAPVGALNISNDEICIGRGLSAIQPFQNKWFLYYFLLTFQKKIVGNGGSIFDSINKEQIEKIETFIPKLNEQQKIASCLSSLDDLITAENQKLEALKAHKKGLMQQLLPAEGKSVPELRFEEFRESGVWEEKKLAELSLKIGDGIHATPIYDDYGDYFFINGNNLIDGKIICDEKTKKVSEDEFEKYKTPLGSNTILLSINGTIGNISFYNNEKVILGKSACFINVDETKLNKKFAASYLATNTIEKYFTTELTGSTIKNLSLKSIRDAVLRIPGKKEQQKIADCLSSLDELITAQAEKIEALKEHKKGLMQGLFPNPEGA